MNFYFMADRGPEIRKRWATIPKNANVLIAHGQLANILENVNGIPL